MPETKEGIRTLKVARALGGGGRSSLAALAG
jgi:hypothetical protein